MFRKLPTPIALLAAGILTFGGVVASAQPSQALTHATITCTPPSGYKMAASYQPKSSTGSALTSTILCKYQSKKKAHRFAYSSMSANPVLTEIATRWYDKHGNLTGVRVEEVGSIADIRSVGFTPPKGGKETVKFTFQVNGVFYAKTLSFKG